MGSMRLRNVLFANTRTLSSFLRKEVDLSYAFFPRCGFTISQANRHPRCGLPFPRGTPPVCVYSGIKSFEWGVQHLEREGLSIPVYSAARTVADCFKYRNKFGLDVAVEALHEGYRLKKFTIQELHQAGDICRVSNVMSPYIIGMLQ